MQILSPDPKLHASQLFELVQLCNHVPVEKSREYYINNSNYDWRTSQIGILDDKIVAHYGVWGYPMHIGAATLLTAGVGCVATHPDYRGRGLSRDLCLACLGQMRANGYQFSRLSGIRDFYHKFGYVRGWTETVYTIKTADLPQQACPVRRCSTAHSEDAAKAYNRFYRQVAGMALRPTFLKSNTVVSEHGLYRWDDRHGRLAGYVIAKPLPDEKALHCCEYVGDAQTALAVLGSLAHAHGCEKVIFESIPEQSELLMILRRGNLQASMEYIASGGNMVRLISLSTALRAMQPEFQRLLRQSHFAAWRGTLGIRWEGEVASLRISRSKVELAKDGAAQHSISGGHALAQLLLGSEAPEEIVAAGKLRLRGEAKSLLAVLFPRRYPMLSFADRY